MYEPTYLHSSRVIAIDYNCLRCCRGRRALSLASNLYTCVLKANILQSFAAILLSFASNSSLIAATLSCIAFYLTLSASALRSIISRNSISGAGYGDKVNIGLSLRGRGEDGNTVDISSGRRERRMDNASLLSLLGICVFYKNLSKLHSLLYLTSRVLV